MMDGVSLKLRRALALTILLTVLVLGWTLAVEPLIDLSRDRQADIAALSDQLAHLQAIIGRQPALARRAATEQSALSAEGGLWNGASAAEVAAAMQDRLRKVVSASGGRLRSTAMVAEAAERGFHRVTVHFSIEGTLDTVTATLAAIEAAHPAMFVDLLAIHAAGVASANRPPALATELDVSGTMTGPGSR
jgi:hypothetical protein